MTPLLEPLTLGRHTMRNRIVQGPLSVGYAAPDGQVTDTTIGHYARRAQGGVGMVMIENYAVSWPGRQMPQQGMAANEEFLPGLRRLAAAIHEQGAVAVLQLVHAGRYAGPWERYEDERRLAPSAVGFELTPGRTVTPQEITRQEISDSIAAFATATRIAREAGFDGVDIHGAQGFLISSFQSPLMNRREDEYGGNATGRNRFAREVVDAVVAAASGELLVGYHLFSDEMSDGGWAQEDAVDFVAALRGRGLDFLVPIPTTFESMRRLRMAGHGDPTHHVPELIGRLKEVADCAVFANGGLGEPADAERAMTQDGADAIVLARPLLADPDWVAKVSGGRPETLLRCACDPPRCAQTQMTGAICSAWPESVQAAGAWLLDDTPTTNEAPA